MAQRKQTALDQPTKRQLAAKAKTAQGVEALGKLADSNLACDPKNHWRKLSEEHKETILLRVQAGETLSTVCKRLGLNTGVVNQHAWNDKEYGERLLLARRLGTHAQVDRLLDLPFDDTMDIEDKKLLFKGITWTASRVNPASYGDKQEVTHTVQQAPVVLPMEAMVIDAVPLDDDTLVGDE